jgi:enterochelin esterase-like enzyme
MQGTHSEITSSSDALVFCAGGSILVRPLKTGNDGGMSMMARKSFAALAVLISLAFLTARLGHAQAQTEAPPVVSGAKAVAVEHVKVHGKSLEGNLEGDAVDRDVIVFLPPSYNANKQRRYPVVYALHGYSIGAEQWTHEIHVPQTIEGSFAQGTKEMIVVLPDSKTIYAGSFYSSSVTTGDFEQFISHDLVEYIDAHYRTIANRTSRGLAGHSMGGYGTARIGMKHPDVYGAIYVMSACCMTAPAMMGFNPPANPKASEETDKAIAAAKSPAEAAKAARMPAALGTAAAWAPNPKNPPLYLDLAVKDGVAQPEIQAKWMANAALDMVDQYIGNLRQYRAIGIEVGDKDGGVASATKFHEVLNSYGIANQFELFEGTHTSKVAFRFQEHTLPFFSKNLCFTADCR